MKMADSGFRPAYNCQVASVAEGQIAIAVDVSTVGSDRGLMRPMLERIAGLYGRPKRHLVDGGFNKNEDIEWAAAEGIRECQIFCVRDLCEGGIVVGPGISRTPPSIPWWPTLAVQQALSRP